ncbi:hypothetical protein ACFPVY_03940 [Flavobacterium qiangtangense]|uniref:Uncharacterized protein n=1 Tax=Flavobacterium qiangtangense TaxID=1442595 RepID=A0ABW1PLE9_9FLAO
MRYSSGTIIQSYIDKGKIGNIKQDDVELTFIELRMQLLKMDEDNKNICVNLLKQFIDGGKNDNLKCILDV